MLIFILNIFVTSLTTKVLLLIHLKCLTKILANNISYKYSRMCKSIIMLYLNKAVLYKRTALCSYLVLFLLHR